MTTREARVLRDAIADTAQRWPTLQTWLDRAARVSPAVASAVEGIWAGREGRAECEIPGSDYRIIVGWCYGHVEFAYVA